MARITIYDRTELEDFKLESINSASDITSLTFKLNESDFNEQCKNKTYNTETMVVVGINQQTGNKEFTTYQPVSGSNEATYTVNDWPNGYYKIEIRQYETTSGTSINNIIPDSYTNCHTKPLYWNKSPIKCMTYIAPGTFMMGSPENEYGHFVTTGWNKETLHKVTLTQAMYAMRTTVTVKDFSLIMNKPTVTSYQSGYKHNNSTYAADGSDYYNTNKQSSNLSINYQPMRLISWQDIMWDINRSIYPNGDELYHTNDKSIVSRLNDNSVTALNNLRISGFTWDLPSEAMWEYICRAGTNTALPSGQNLNYPTSQETGGSDSTPQPNLNRIGWYNLNSGNSLKVVGLKMPNKWGLFDTVGNVWEWCQDLSGRSYPRAPETNPGNFNTSSASSRVIRGGGYSNTARNCRSGLRNSYYGSLRYSDYGFRLVLIEED